MSENTESHLPIGLLKGDMKREWRQKQIALKARIKYREQALQGYKRHLKNGTFPKRFISLKPYPKMPTPEAQTMVNQACQQVDKIILDQLILEQERRLKRDQDSIQTMKEDQDKCKTVKNAPETDFQTFLIATLRKEANDLRAKNAVLKRKYTRLSRKMEKRSVKQERKDILSE